MTIDEYADQCYAALDVPTNTLPQLVCAAAATEELPITVGGRRVTVRPKAGSRRDVEYVLNGAPYRPRSNRECDKPAGGGANIGCVPGSRFRVATQRSRGGKIVNWYFLCRAKEWEREGNRVLPTFEAAGVIAYRADNGATCFFDVNPYWVWNSSGDQDLPLPGSHRREPVTDASKLMWSKQLNCTACHEAYPLLHSPWLAQARRHQIPKHREMEKYTPFPRAFVFTMDNARPITRKVLVSSSPRDPTGEANASSCLGCHRVGLTARVNRFFRERIGAPEIRRGVPTDFSTAFPKYYSMPENHGMSTRADWLDSFEREVKDLYECGENDCTVLRP